MKKILFLEDNINIASNVKSFMEKEDFSVDIVHSIKEFVNQNWRLYDLILMDCNLPDGDAFEPAKRISTIKKPFLFLTVKDTEDEIIKGLELGAEDYITKPFSLPILSARIKTVLRRYNNEKEKILYYEKLTLDTEGKKLFINGKEIELTKTEYELLLLFMTNPGKLLRRDLLLSKIWDNRGNFVEDNTLSVNIRRLREKLVPYENLIQTVRGMGYRFNEK